MQGLAALRKSRIVLRKAIRGNSMNQIITINTQLGVSINARDLHIALEVGRDFSSWIRPQLEDFIENQDYILLPRTGEQTGRGGHNQINYALTLDTAKHIALMSKTEKGRQYRQALINLEKDSLIHNPATDGMGAMILAADALNVCESSKLQILTSVAEHFNLPTTFLPKYAIDAPSTTTAGSSEVTYSATHLLYSHNPRISVRKFNALAAAAGLIEQKYRKSTKSPSKTKKYWSLTEKGLAFGKNITNPSSPRETQPHWFQNTFNDVLDMLL